MSTNDIIIPVIREITHTMLNIVWMKNQPPDPNTQQHTHASMLWYYIYWQ